MKKLLLYALIVSLAACNNSGKDPVTNGKENPNTPRSMSYSIVKTFPHDTSSYTQGLIVYNGELYEGTGLENKSKLRKVDLATGKPLREINLAPEFFGEGITILNDTIYQLTYENHKVFMYSLKDFRLLKEFPLDTEGWGITTDGKELIVSDGSSNLSFYEPGTFRKLRTVSVTDAGELANNVNELEWINGYVYANKYQTNYILKIDPVTGIIVAKADLSQLGDAMRRDYPFIDVLNGIAYDSASKKIYITGKWWPNLYEIKFGE